MYVLLAHTRPRMFYIHLVLNFECNLLQSHVASFEWSHALHLPDWMN